jgi:hypothetical protein
MGESEWRLWSGPLFARFSSPVQCSAKIKLIKLNYEFLIPHLRLFERERERERINFDDLLF